MIPFHGHSEPAPESEGNQDAFVVRPTGDGGLLLLVCDGMGGMGRGAEASRMATRVLEDHLREGGRIGVMDAALRTADAQLRRELVDPGPGRPGCTAIMTLIHEDEVDVAWVGDSRALHIRGGRILNHTIDHKLIEELVASGTLTREQALGGRMGHVITRCLGGRKSSEPAHEPELSTTPWQLQPGDALVLCSDGLTDVVDETEVPDLIAGCEVEEAVHRLVQTATERGTSDDTTVIVYRHPAVSRSFTAPVAPDSPATRSDPLLHLATPTQRPTTRTTITPTTEPSPERRGSRLSWVLLVAAVVCIALSGVLIAAWFGGLL